VTGPSLEIAGLYIFLADGQIFAFFLDRRAFLIDIIIEGGVGGYDSFARIC
jgi:hypothetical protein